MTSDGVPPDFRLCIDWRQPWLAPLRGRGEPLCDAQCDWRARINEHARQAGMRNHRDQPICFVRQSELPAGLGYEAYIGATGRVPTRENLHDFFNAQVWLAFPRIKARLNALQAADIARQDAESGGVTAAHRGQLRDALTIFDESSALMVSSDSRLFDALRAHDWTTVFVDRREGFNRDCEVFLFGHALMEKLVAPYKGITAHAWLVQVDAAYFAWPESERMAHVDQIIAGQLTSGLRNADYTPLPLMGIPGWSADQDAAFYADPSVFRARRRRL
ncbi:DUF3025 domain-containing protein [Actimicrobium antarcticum]|uniref:DUF3025 domain-containing protein n=1 Tax=Actimicrobium antarcticum TaxID=1051899 RepID=A0ABP7SN93_9BURK